MEIKYYLESNIPQFPPNKENWIFTVLYIPSFQKYSQKEIMTQSIFIWESKFK